MINSYATEVMFNYVLAEKPGNICNVKTAIKMSQYIVAITNG